MMILPRLPARSLRDQLRRYSVRAPALQTQPFTKDKTLADLKGWVPDIPDPEVQVYGHVRSRRKLGQVSFVNLTDGSSMRPLQAVVPRQLTAGYVSMLPFKAPLLTVCRLSPGSAVYMKGIWHVRSGDAERAAADTASPAQEADVTPISDGPPAAEGPGGGVELTQPHASRAGDAISSGSSVGAQASGELQVTHVELLGQSNAQASAPYA